jgi:phosphinothricin acetyltransferase
MPATVIRPAVPADIPAITSIYGEAVRSGTASFEWTPPDEAEMTRRMGLIRDRGFPYLVAEEAGAVRGYGYAGPYHTRPGYRWTVEDSIYVAPDAQRRGVGRRLLAGLIADVEAGGYRQMVAVIGDSANAGSIGLHAALGFRQVGTFRSVGFKFGRWLDSVIMQRALGPGDGSVP